VRCKLGRRLLVRTLMLSKLLVGFLTFLVGIMFRPLSRSRRPMFRLVFLLRRTMLRLPCWRRRFHFQLGKLLNRLSLVACRLSPFGSLLVRALRLSRGSLDRRCKDLFLSLLLLLLLPGFRRGLLFCCLIFLVVVLFLGSRILFWLR